jgi:predicted Zn-dependent peptidase
VRREQVALGAHATSWGFVDGVSLGFLVVDVAAGQDPEAIEAVVVEELERFAVEGPTDVEMESAMAQSERSWLSALAGQEERADLISEHVLLHGDGQFVNTVLDRIGAVGVEDVRAAAGRWLRPHSRAVVRHLAVRDEEEVA